MKLKRIGVLLLTICVVMSCMSLPARATEGNEAESEITDVIEDEAMDTSEEKSEEKSEEESEEESEVESEEENSETGEEVSEETGDEVIQEESEEEIISDSDEEEDLLTGPVNWTESVTLSQNTTVNGDLTISGLTNLGGYVLTVNGNLIIDAWVDSGDFAAINVSGNLICKSGYFILRDGTAVNVTGDLKFCGLNANGSEVKGTCQLYWIGKGVEINIGGNYLINTSERVNYEITINLNGDLINKSGSNLSDTTINFNGTKQQLIDIPENVTLGHLGGTNNDIKVKKCFNGKLDKNFTIKTDEEIIYVNDSLSLNRYTLSIPSSVVANVWLDTGDFGKLSIGGDFIVKSNYIILRDGAVLDVAGDLRFCGMDVNGNEVKGSGQFYWIGNGVEINIGKDYVINTTGRVNYDFTINLKGDLINKSGNSLASTTINFNGTKQQMIDITKDTDLGHLGGTNDDIKVKNCFNGKLDKSFILKTDEEKIIVNGTLSLNQFELSIPATVVASAWLDTGNFGKLSIDGDFIFTDGYLILADGSVTDISGNFRLCGLDANGNEVKGSGGLYRIGNDPIVNVGGNYEINTSKEVYPAIIVNLKGNLLNKSGNSLNYNTINLVGNVDAQHKQIVDMSSGGKIGTLTLSSCGDFYEITKDCYNKLEKPEHKYDSGVVTKPTTKTTEGEKTFTCTVCGHKHVEKIPRVVNVFNDIDETGWYAEAVQYVYENGIMVGKDENSFNPNGKLSREQLVQMLYSIEGKPEVNINNPYRDVKETQWYYQAVLWAKQTGVATGKGNGTFGIGSQITRQDLTLMLYAYADYKGFDKTTNNSAISGFADANKVSSYAKNAMNWAVTQGIISGKGGNRLDPTGNATRAECALIIMNLLEKN